MAYAHTSETALKCAAVPRLRLRKCDINFYKEDNYLTKCGACAIASNGIRVYERIGVEVIQVNYVISVAETRLPQVYVKVWVNVGVSNEFHHYGAKVVDTTLDKFSEHFS